MDSNIMNYGMNPMMNQQNGIMINDRDLFVISNINRNLAFRNLINNNSAQFWMLRAQQMNWQIQMMLNMFQTGAPAIAPAAGVPVVAPGAVIYIVPVRRRVAHNRLAASQRIQGRRPQLGRMSARRLPVSPHWRNLAHDLSSSQLIHGDRPQLDKIEVRDLSSSQQIMVNADFNLVGSQVVRRNNNMRLS